MREGDCLPYEPIKSRTELISKFAKFERKTILTHPFSCSFGENTTCDEPPAVFVISGDGAEAIICKHPSPFSFDCGEVICGPV